MLQRAGIKSRQNAEMPCLQRVSANMIAGASNLPRTSSWELKSGIHDARAATVGCISSVSGDPVLHDPARAQALWRNLTCSRSRVAASPRRASGRAVPTDVRKLFFLWAPACRASAALWTMWQSCGANEDKRSKRPMTEAGGPTGGSPGDQFIPRPCQLTDQ